MLDRSLLLMGKGYGIKEDVPIYAVLLNTSDGYVLVDTGMNPDGVTNPEMTWGCRAKELVPTVVKEDDIRNRLKEIGVDVDDIKYVINTHMHWDHTGGNRFFEKSTFIVQNEEYRYAYFPDNALKSSYMKNHFDYNLNYNLISGDYDVCEGVRVLSTPGHTAGHQSVLAIFEGGGSLIIGGDAVYTYDNFKNVIPPGNCYDQKLAVLSLHKLRTIQMLTNAEMLPSHEPHIHFYEQADLITERLKLPVKSNKMKKL